MSEWQPIETAPKDDVPVLIYSITDSIQIAHRHQQNQAFSAKPYWVVVQGYDDYAVHPTHWMPLPNPPRAMP